MKYEIPNIILSLIPAAIVHRVQNGLDTALSEGLERKTIRWTSKVGKSKFSITSRERRGREEEGGLTLSPSEAMLHWSIQINNLADEVGAFDVKLPLIIRLWFERLAKAEAEAEAEKAKDTK